MPFLSWAYHVGRLYTDETYRKYNFSLRNLAWESDRYFYRDYRLAHLFTFDFLILPLKYPEWVSDNLNSQIKGFQKHLDNGFWEKGTKPTSAQLKDALRLPLSNWSETLLVSEGLASGRLRPPGAGEKDPILLRFHDFSYLTEWNFVHYRLYTKEALQAELWSLSPPHFIFRSLVGKRPEEFLTTTSLAFGAVSLAKHVANQYKRELNPMKVWNNESNNANASVFHPEGSWKRLKVKHLLLLVFWIAGEIYCLPRFPKRDFASTEPAPSAHQ